jgi:hypothetical protein
MEFIYFSDEWNEKRKDGDKTRAGGTHPPRMAPCSAHAYASEEQEEIYQKNKTQK